MHHGFAPKFHCSMLRNVLFLCMLITAKQVGSSSSTLGTSCVFAENLRFFVRIIQKKKKNRRACWFILWREQKCCLNVQCLTHQFSKNVRSTLGNSDVQRIYSCTIVAQASDRYLTAGDFASDP